MPILSLLYGSLVGLSLGLTGGGGAIFAVPLLVYGLAIPAHQAVGISLAAVGGTALVGFLHRWWLGEVDVRSGLLLAAGGMLGAPLGTWIAGFFSDRVLLSLFAVLMVTVAVRLWRHSHTTDVLPDALPEVGGDGADCEPVRGGLCRCDAQGRLLVDARCVLLLLAVGLATGVLAGMFGVGGGLVIVPALVMIGGMAIHRAVGTSLMVIALVSVSGVASHIWAGREISLEVTALFVAGGVAGLLVGQRIGSLLSGPMLARVFVVAILLVAAFVIVRNVAAGTSAANPTAREARLNVHWFGTQRA